MSAINEYFSETQAWGRKFIPYAQQRIKTGANSFVNLSKVDRQKLGRIIKGTMQDSQTTQAIQSLLEKQEKEAEQIYSKAILDRSTGRAYSPQVKTLKEDASPVTIAKKIEQMQKILNILNQDIKDGRLNGDKYSRDIEKLQNELFKLIEAPNKNKINNFIEEFNTALSTFGYNVLNSALFQGDFFEQVIQEAVTRIKDSAEDLASQNIINIISSEVVGGDKIKATFELIGVEKTQSAKTKKIYSRLTTAKNRQSLCESEIGEYSQGKIDIAVRFKDPFGDIKLLGISAKNIAEISNIHIVGNTNMTTILSNEDFNYQKYFVLSRWSKFLDNYSETAAANNAFLSFQMLAVYKGLTGDALKRDKASLFIINDNANKTVHLLNMSDLIRALYGPVTGIQSYINSNYSFIWGVDPVLNIKGKENINDVIARLMKDANSKKLSIIFKGFKNFSKKSANIQY